MLRGMIDWQTKGRVHADGPPPYDRSRHFSAVGSDSVVRDGGHDVDCEAVAEGSLGEGSTFAR